MSDPQGSRTRVDAWIRSNILGLVAIFIALTGSAVASQAVREEGATTAKAKKGPRGPAGPPGPQGAPGTPGLLTGAAGGDLTGNYPNPTIAPEAIGPSETGIVPAAKVNNNSDITVPGDSDPVTLPFDSEQFDYSDMHDNVVENFNLVAPIAGVYLVQATVFWNAAAGGVRTITFDGSGFGSIDSQAPLPTGNAVNNLSTIVELSAGDAMSVIARQSTDTSLIANGVFSMIWLGPRAPA